MALTGNLRTTAGGSLLATTVDGADMLLHLDQVTDEANLTGWVLRSRDPVATDPSQDTDLATYTDFEQPLPLVALDEHTGEMWIAERRNDNRTWFYQLDTTTWTLGASTWSSTQDLATYPGGRLSAFCIDYPDYVDASSPGEGHLVFGYSNAGGAYYRDADISGGLNRAEFFDTGHASALRGLFHHPPGPGGPDHLLHSVSADGTINQHTGERLGAATQTWHASGTYRKTGTIEPALAEYESETGAVRTFTMKNRARVVLTAPALMETEEPEDPDALTLYLAAGTKPTTPEDWYRQPPPPPGVRRVVVTEMATDLGTAPVASSFPQAIPGRLRSAAEDDLGPMIAIRGDGTGRAGPITWTPNEAALSDIPLQPVQSGSIATGPITGNGTWQNVAAVTFPTPFPRTPEIVLQEYTGYSTAVSNAPVFIPYNRTPAGFDIRAKAGANLNTQAVMWIATCPPGLADPVTPIEPMEPLELDPDPEAINDQDRETP